MKYKCPACKLILPASMFYRNRHVSSGRFSRCKPCIRTSSQAYYEKKRKDPAFVEKQKEINHQRYYNKSPLDEKLYRFRVRVRSYFNYYLDKPKSVEIHHWCYNSSFEYHDGLFMTTRDHKRCHLYLTLCKETFFFKGDGGQLLDTFEKHVTYIINHLNKNHAEK